MRTITIRDRLRYRFDSIMARGTIALIAWLFLVSAAVILVVSALVVVTGVGPKDEAGTGMSFWGAAWMAMMRTLDAGTMGGDTGSRPFLAAMFGVTLTGVFVVSGLIGLINNGIQDQVDKLRKGRSIVCETGHTLILGWGPQIFTMLREIALAAAQRGGSAIVILADKDKVEMEDEIRAKHVDFGKTRVVCRTGSPIDPHDLEIVSPGAARSIIVLAPDSERPDAHVIKTLLALMHDARPAGERLRVVAEIHDPRNRDAALLVGKDQAHLVMIEELIAKITVQTCREAGLSAVYMELLSFAGNELYIHEEPALAGKAFGDALGSFESAALVGLIRAGEVLLNPPMDAVFARGDEAILIAEGESRTRVGKPAVIDEEAIRKATPRPRAPERTLMLGWNDRCLLIVAELMKYVAPGSTMLIVADVEGAEETLAARCKPAPGVALSFQRGDTTDRHVLDALEIPGFDHVITVSSEEAGDAHEADAHTLVTLLHLRDIKRRADAAFSITSEMLDVRNRELAEVTEADDFIVSDTLGSLVLAQISENPEVREVFQDLFDPEGSEIYLRPAGDYVAAATSVTFATIVEAARRRGEVAIGYRLKEKASEAPRYGVRLNPLKSSKVSLGAADRVIVLAVE